MTEYGFADRFYARIKGGVTAVATTINLYPGYLGPLLKHWNSSRVIEMAIVNAIGNIEVVVVTGISVSKDQITVTRGGGARAWRNGDIVTCRLTANACGNFIQKEGYRTYTAFPHGVLTCDYVGEELLENSERWWKALGGTDWQLIAGEIDISWQSVSASSSYGETRIAWGAEAGVFCTFHAEAGTHYTSTSADGDTWTKHALPVLSGAVAASTQLCYSPTLEKFCIVRATSTGATRAYLSSDGANWTGPYSFGNNAVDLAGAMWSEELGLFIVTYKVSGSVYIYTSSDGQTWNLRRTMVGGYIYKFANFPGVGVIAAMYDGSSNKKAVLSTDGLDFTTEYALPNNNFYTRTACSDSLVVMIAANQTTVITSPDGQNWTEVDITMDVGARVWRAIEYGGDRWVAVADEDGLSSYASMASKDGANWTATEIGAYDWNDVAYSPELGLWVAAAQNENFMKKSYYGGIAQ